MPLRLRVTSENRNLLGERADVEFAACGGTIGRNADNDWILPDPKRYISGRHALIDFQGGAYYIVDTSRNGVYINGADSPVGRGHPQRLFDGDRLRLGDFDVSCELTEEAGEAIDDGMRDSVVRAQLVDEDESVEMQLVDENRITDESMLARHLSELGPGLQRLSQRLLPDGLEFDLATLEEIDHARRAIGFHCPSPFDFNIHHLRVDRETHGGSTRDHLHHQGAYLGLDPRIGEQQVGRLATLGDRQAIEGHVPDQLSPLRGLQVFGQLARDVRRLEALDQLPGTWVAGLRLPFADRHLPPCGVTHHTRRKSIKADETQTTENPPGSDDFGNPLAVPQSVLKGKDLGSCVA